MKTNNPVIPPSYSCCCLNIQLIVLNRLNASNMTQPIAEAMRLKLVKLYLMFLSPDPCSMGEESLMEVPHGKRKRERYTYRWLSKS